MNCQTFAETIVDVARGRDVGAGTVAAVESHIEHCTVCRARFAREQRLSEGLRALAASVADHGADGLEARLLDAFTAPQSAMVVGPARANHKWLQVAAALILVTGLIAAWQVPRAPRVGTVPAVAPSPAPQQTATAVVTPTAPINVKEQPQAPKQAVQKPRPSRIVRAKWASPGNVSSSLSIGSCSTA